MKKIENDELDQIKFIASVDIVDKGDLSTFSLTKVDNKNRVLAAFEMIQKNPHSYDSQFYVESILQQIENGEIKIS